MPEGQKKSRLTSLKAVDENSSFLKLPDIEGAEYLVGLLNEAGMVLNNGMGVSSLDWKEIHAWLEVTQLELSIWEKLTLKEMSEIYASELSKATAKDATAPYVEVVEEEVDRKAVANKIRSVFASFKRKQEPDPQD